MNIVQPNFITCTMEALRFFIVAHTIGTDCKLLNAQDRYDLIPYAEYIVDQIDNEEIPLNYQDWLYEHRNDEPSYDDYDTTGSNSNYNHYNY